MLTKLQLPLNEFELKNGWSTEAQQSGITFLENLKARILSREQIPEMSIVRALDSWGVVSGELLNLHAELSNMLNEHY